MSRLTRLAEGEGFELSVSISRTVARRPSWITVTRGPSPRALEHACRRSRLSKPSMLARAPSTPAALAQPRGQVATRPKAGIGIPALS